MPKPMLPVLDKPTIQYIAEELLSVGIEEVIIVVSPGSDVIEKHFGKAEELIGTLLFLVHKDASSFVNGVVIPVDGGFSAYSGV